MDSTASRPGLAGPGPDGRSLGSRRGVCVPRRDCPGRSAAGVGRTRCADGGRGRGAADRAGRPGRAGQPRPCAGPKVAGQAYLSVPLSVDGTSLFGTLCAVDLDPQPAQVVVRLPQVELQARLLPLCSPPTCGSTRRTAGPSGRKPTRYSSR